MSVTVAASPRGTKVGFTAAGGSHTQLVVAVAPKLWRPPGVSKLVAVPSEAGHGHHSVTLYEKDRLHLHPSNPELEKLIDACLRVCKPATDGEPFGSRLLEMDHPPASSKLADARSLSPAAFETATDLLSLFDRLDLLRPQADDLRAVPQRSLLHRPLLYRRFLDEVHALINFARRGYASVSKIRTSVRGRVDPTSAARYALTQEPRLQCRYDELTESTTLLGIVCAGLEWIANGAGVHSPFAGRFDERHLRHDAVTLRRILGEVTALAAQRALLIGPKLHLSRLDQAWEDALHLSLAILSETEPIAGPRGQRRHSDAVELAVSTDKLWERVVNQVLMRSEFSKVLAQGSQPSHLVADPWIFYPAKLAKSRPDNVAWRDRELWVVDAKYKERLAGSTPGRDDQYQLFAYSHLVRDRDRDVRVALMLYPGNAQADSWTRGRDNRSAPARLIAGFLPFPEPTDVRTKISWLAYLDAAAAYLRRELHGVLGESRLKPSS